MLRLSRSRERKERMFKYFEDLIRKYRYILFVDSNRLKANILTEIRRLQGELNFVIKGGKKTVFLKALEAARPEIAELIKNNENIIFGQRIFIFTNEDPIRIAVTLDKFEIDIEASPGDIAPKDIIIPAGNTGIPPGPIISIFSSLSIPTKIVGGAINIVKDTLVARAGDKISPNLANLLSKLGIKPIRVKANLVAAIDMEEKIVIPREYLIPDLEKIGRDVASAFENAVKITLEIGYPTRYNIQGLIIKALISAKKVAIESGYVSPDTVTDVVILAYVKAMALERELSLSK
jgi:large subunit ribosomal protein L10